VGTNGAFGFVERAPAVSFRTLLSKSLIAKSFNILFQATITSSRFWSCVLYGGSRYEEDLWKD
jgi:hypothetical protein